MTNNELRICMFGSELAPSKNGVFVGGAVSSAVNLSKGLADAGHDIHVVSLPPRDWASNRDKVVTDWAEIRIVPGKSQHVSLAQGIRSFVNATRAISDYCQTNDIDVIHSHSGFAILAAASIAAGWRTNLPVVHSLYCPVPTKDFDGLSQRLSSPMGTKLLLERTDHTLAMSETVRQSIEKSGVSAPVSVVPPIVDHEKFQPNIQKPNSVLINDNRFTILFVGSLKKTKGLEYLIRAVSHVKEYVPVQLIITLERAFPKAKERWKYIQDELKEAGIEESVEVLGIIDDMPNLMSHADLLAAPFLTTRGPSDYPVAVLEAMASGTQVVGTRIGGIAYLLEDGRGHLVPPKDSNALAEKLIAVSEEDIPNHTSDAREFVKKNFSEHAVVEMVERIYRKAL